MKSYYKVILIFFGVLAFESTKGQVLISLLFGDKLNTPGIEFGLIGGMNRSYFNDVSNSEGLNNFNLGFYFHILLKNQSYLSTGVLVKSDVGAAGMSTYALGNPDLDNLFANGTLTTKINYFYVPIMFHQRFSRWYLEGGIQTGPRHNATDIFETEAQGGDVTFKLKTKDDYTWFDFGLKGGIGYKLKKELKSMSVGTHYYYGLVDISKSENTTTKNSSIYFFIKIPIGASKKIKEETVKQ